MNRVRCIVRVCAPCRMQGPGVDRCWGGGKARVPGETCQWRAELMHPLDEPEDLQKLIPDDVPGGKVL